MDRGVVLGQRSFGKGLVQNVIPLSYNSQMKLTVAKYYIPSGRCIQAIDYSHKDEDGHFSKIPDSLVNEFETMNGRKVYDGGGIEPDIRMQPRKYSRILISLLSRFLIFDYATSFVKENPEIGSPEEFEITDEIYDDFREFLADKEYDYVTACEEKLDDLKESATAEGSFEEIKGYYEQLRTAMLDHKKDDLISHRDEISELLKLEIVTRYYYQEGKVRASLRSDPEIRRAIQILLDPVTYESILKGTYTEEAIGVEADSGDKG
jgi:carboxyl-terminal processing protease